MSRVSGCLWLAVALVLAVVAGGVAFVTMQKATVAKAEGASPVAMTSVVVAAHPMPVGALLSEKDLTLQTLPSAALPAGALNSVADAGGQLTMVPLNAGEMILSHHLTYPDITGDNLAFTLPEGLVAVTLGAEDTLSTVSVIKPGDKVDILYSLEVPAGAQPSGVVGGPNAATTAAGRDDKQWTFGTLQSVTVVTVVRSEAKDSNNNSATTGDATNQALDLRPARAYILALPPQDALVLKYLKDANAVMDLALRNAADETDHNAQPVDLQYLMDKFQLKTR